MSTTKTSTTAKRSTASIRASRPLMGWRTVDLLTVTFLGAAFGVAYWAWGQVYAVPGDALGALFPPLAAIVGAPWLLAGVVGGLVVRRPGAALLCEVLAALVSMLPGTKWGFSTFVAGVLQGLGAEPRLRHPRLRRVRHRRGGLCRGAVRAARGRLRVVHVLGRLDLGLEDRLPAHPHGSGAVIAGVGGWLLTRALASAGALNAFLRARRPGSTALSEVATVLPRVGAGRVEVSG